LRIFLLRVHHGRVVAAAERLPDLGAARVRQLSAQIHGDLPRLGERLGLAGPHRSSIVTPKNSAVTAMNRRGADLRHLGVRNQVPAARSRPAQIDRLPVERRERGDPDQRALELADVVLDPAAMNSSTSAARSAVLSRFLAQDAIRVSSSAAGCR